MAFTKGKIPSAPYKVYRGYFICTVRDRIWIELDGVIIRHEVKDLDEAKNEIDILLG